MGILLKSSVRRNRNMKILFYDTKNYDKESFDKQSKNYPGNRDGLSEDRPYTENCAAGKGI